jgi:hypothetical protein
MHYITGASTFHLKFTIVLAAETLRCPEGCYTNPIGDASVIMRFGPRRMWPHGPRSGR